MTDHSMRVSGAEPDVEGFRQELVGQLRAAGIPVDGVQISSPRPVPVPLTEPAPLGHIEWVEIVIKIAIGALTPAATELAKELIRRYVQIHRVKSTDTATSGSPT